MIDLAAMDAEAELALARKAQLEENLSSRAPPGGGRSAGACVKAGKGQHITN